MRRRDRAFWKKLAGELGRSDLSHTEFAREHHVHVATLRSWIYRFRREDAAMAPALVPVRVVASTAPSARWQDDGAATIEAMLPSGVRLRFQLGADLEYVAEIVRRIG